MIAKFQINYHTDWGQQIFVCGSSAKLGKWEHHNAQPMVFRGNGVWELEYQVRKDQKVAYKYFIRHKDNTVEWEFGDARQVEISEDCDIHDFWRSNQSGANVLYSSPFKRAFFNRKTTASKKVVKSKNLTLSIRAPQIAANHELCILGNANQLGSWKEDKMVAMDDSNFPVWSIDLKVGPKNTTLEYKYVIRDKKTKGVVAYELGDNRRIVRDPNLPLIINDEYFNHPDGNWRGAGVAIPVFSLRTNQGFGIGEFLDLKPLVDWSAKTGLQLIQVLPVNDTTASHTWVDSYPYAGISVFALHPIYANLQAIGHLKDRKQQDVFDKKQKELNSLDTVDYEEVVKYKSKYFKLKYDEVKATFLKSKEFKAFFKENSEWLIPYAVFSYLRDLNGTANYTTWKKYRKISGDQLKKLADPSGKQYDHIAIHYFIQFHLDKQLKEATNYARSNNVVLKGDIPIGIYRHSVDAWIAPHLYNMDGQAGAPPDAFSSSGQNWGFPTYNWDEMAKDGYLWWRNRLSKMADYFDVFRIDHILGFFRIWEIPWSAVEGTLGRFNPSLPVTLEELNQWGIDFNYDRLCKPYLRDYIINDLFGESAGMVRTTFLNELFPGVYNFKDEFDTQRKIKGHFDQLEQNDHNQMLRHGLYQMARDVIFLEAPLSNGQAFNLNIDLFNTNSFRDLDGFQQSQILELHRQYFFHRHNDFWRGQAMEKLPAIKSATDMLICGEDLGMVPDSVPGVMTELQILSLAVQRMPNDNSKEFWHPADTDYLSVCTTGSHDTSTLRQWWEEDRGKTQRFYNEILGNGGEAPFYCEPWVVNQVITQHLHSPSMWAIFPIQDLLALDQDIRRVFPQEEHINRPEIIPHYWRYRLHLNLEDLIDEEEFNEQLKQMVIDSGRKH